MKLLDRIEHLMEHPIPSEGLSYKAMYFYSMLEGATDKSCVVKCLTNAGIVEGTWYSLKGCQKYPSFLGLNDVSVTLNGGKTVKWDNLHLDFAEIVALSVHTP